MNTLNVMSYFSTPYKFGIKTAAQIAAISTSVLEVGDNVFNSDIGKEEYWTGNNWINDDCVEMRNTQGSTLNIGEIVGVNQTLATSTVASCDLITNIENDWQLGVVYKSAANNAQVAIACLGKYKVLFANDVSSVTRQHIAQVSTTTGRANSTGVKTGGTGSVGVIAESFSPMPVDRLVTVWLQAPESF